MIIKWARHLKIIFLLTLLTGCKLASDGTNDSATNAELQKAVIARIGKDMVYVSEGAYSDGCEGSTDARQLVSVRKFYISRFEVTQEEWQAVMDTNPSFSKCPDCPVNNISMADAEKFIIKLNALSGKKYRLPAEAEWKYMKRGGKASLGYKYSGSITQKFDSAAPNVHPVNQLDSNEMGIYDLDSNDVWEFCFGSNPTGYIEVIRSAYSLRADENTRWCVMAFRSFIRPQRREYSLGLSLERDY